jgi:cell wall-associated NlpC family hydrolase
VELMPHSRHRARHSSSVVAAAGARIAPRAAVIAAVAVACAAILPAGQAGAAPSSGTPSLSATLAKANALSEQIDNLSEQYDGLKIQLTQAKTQAADARAEAARDEGILSQDEAYIGAIAAESYMSASVNPSIQLLQSSSPQTLLNRASIMTQIEQENGAKMDLVADAANAAVRAQAAAAQEQSKATTLAAQMQGKVAAIQKREDFFNSQAFAEADAIYSKTGTYPDLPVAGDSLGVQALREALTKLGDPYVWGAAGPSAFDCSGLVVWSYGQLGVSLEHYTGDLWNEGQHISRSELEPGDLVFFYPDIGHVGIYYGNGLMVDAPTFGQPVQIQPVMWNVYVGAVRIVG